MVVALTAGWSTSAAALPLLPPPPITLPTLTLPTVTVPPVTVPPVTTPVVTTPAVTTPTLPVPPQAPPAPRVPHVTPPALQPPPSRPQSDSGPRGSAGAPTRPIREGGPRRAGNRPPGSVSLVTGSSRRGPHGKRRTTLVFILRRPALVEFVVLQVAPDCRRVGRFRVRGHRGVNRVRVPNRVGREPTGARDVQGRGASDSGRSNGRARAARRRRSREPRRDPSGPESRLVRAGSSVGSSDPARPPAGALSVPARPKSARHPARHHGVLGARFTKSAISSPRRTFRSGSTPCSPSRSRCSERRRPSPKIETVGLSGVAPAGSRRRHDPPRLDVSRTRRAG